MKRYEEEGLREGYRLIAGVDEVGRGPLAGPVVAAAVLFTSPPPDILGIKDSKALRPAQRETLLLSINMEALSIGLGLVWPSAIDEINIHHASLLAMERAVALLNPAPHLLLIDGLYPISSPLPQKPIVRGDSQSLSIAAASIVAKTARDRMMDGYDSLYPGYGFKRNKGYGTKSHREALGRLGSTAIHRKSFRGVKQVSAAVEVEPVACESGRKLPR
ncbi:MAG: ribonuclease HII [Thermodesulfobacteriota bacterium]